ncbi:MAG: ribonuclease R [Ignavibacteriales bacterium]|nr:ribonuclease R [Ignavibacteriales bacterium]
MRERILEFLRRYPNQTFKSQELQRRLSIKDENEYRSLRIALGELEKEKLVLRIKGKHYKHQSHQSNRYVGTFAMKKGFGVVQVDNEEFREILIPQKFCSTAMDGDMVEVALFADLFDKAKQTKHTLKAERHEGEIIKIIKRAKEEIVGRFERSGNFYFVVPDDGKKSGRDIYIPKSAMNKAKVGEKVIAVVERWEDRNLNPEGRVVEVLGKSGEVRAEMMSVIREFKLPEKFPSYVIDEAEEVATEISKEEITTRLDLREEKIFTIDPEDAKDFDDAVSLEVLENGNFSLGVHIADVSHYVTENSQLDKEAFKRGTSVYLADAVVPMLPEELSNNICSLRPNVDRLTYSAFMEITPRGAVKNYDIKKSVINSKRRFTYEEVQKIIETKRGDFADEILMMYKFSQVLLKKRLREGSVDFGSEEAKFRFDEFGKPTEIIKKVRLDSHRLIEEFMLLANQTVAKHIAVQPKKRDAKTQQAIRPFVYRIHDSPLKEKLDELALFVKQFGYSLPPQNVTSKALQKLIEQARGKEEENLINDVAIRSMAKAIYSENNIGHYGLGFQYYTHFTSPIRRYPDLIIHRLLFEYEKGMNAERNNFFQKNLPLICKQSSDRERVAMEAERESTKVMQVEYMKRHIGDEFHGLISGVTNFGLFVKITDLLTEGMIRLRDLDDDYYVYDEKNYCIIGKRMKKRYRMGDKVNVKVIRVDSVERRMDFALK